MQVLLERPAEVIQSFLPHQAIALAIWTVFFCPKNLRTFGFEVPVQPFVELLEPQFHWDSTLLARDQRFQDLRFLFFAQSNLEFMKEEIFFSPPRMPVAIFDRLRIPGALFHFILLAGGGVEP